MSSPAFSGLQAERDQLAEDLKQLGEQGGEVVLTPLEVSDLQQRLAQLDRLIDFEKRKLP